MKLLSKRTLTDIAQTYRRAHGLRPAFWYPDGSRLSGTASLLDAMAKMREARSHALQESARWGEPYTFFILPGVTSWMVPIVDRYHLFAGVTGGEVLPDAADRESEDAIQHLMWHGTTREEAKRYLAKLPIRSQTQCRAAANALFELVYRISGLPPTLLNEQRARTRQQRQIAEEVHRRKRAQDHQSAIDEERALLTLIRAGDRNGARCILNQMLGRVFLRSADLTIIRALMIEMMGYLVRRAIEDNPTLEPIMEKNHHWMAQIIEVENFENLAAVLRQALDDFMEQIYETGHAHSPPHVVNALNFVATHYRESIGLSDVAREVGLSTYRMAHLIKAQTGKPLVRHIHLLRIREAKRLLEETAMDVASIAVEVGFYDQSYFTRQFRRYAGLTPARYRRAHRLD